jgi:hypothetical protein
MRRPYITDGRDKEEYKILAETLHERSPHGYREAGNGIMKTCSMRSWYLFQVEINDDENDENTDWEIYLPLNFNLSRILVSFRLVILEFWTHVGDSILLRVRHVLRKTCKNK